MKARNVRPAIGIFAVLTVAVLSLPRLSSIAHACGCSGGNSSNVCRHILTNPCFFYAGGVCVNNFRPDSDCGVTYSSAMVTENSNDFFYCQLDNIPSDSCDNSISTACASFTAYSSANCQGMSVASGNVTSCSASGTPCS